MNLMGLLDLAMICTSFYIGYYRTEKAGDNEFRERLGGLEWKKYFLYMSVIKLFILLIPYIVVQLILNATVYKDLPFEVTFGFIVDNSLLIAIPLLIGSAISVQKLRNSLGNRDTIPKPNK